MQVPKLSLSRRLRHVAARVAGKASPKLYRYALKTEARRRVRFRVNSGTIDLEDRETRRVIRVGRANAVYVKLIAEAFDYFFDSVEPVPTLIDGAIGELVDFSGPRLHRVVGFDDFPVLVPSLMEPFVTTRQYLDFARLKPGDGAIDLGAYCGLSAIAFSKAVGPKGRVVALEPDRLNWSTADRNIAAQRANGLDNISLRRAAMAGKNGYVQFSMEGAMGSALSTIVGSYRGRVEQVRAMTLESLIEAERIDRIDFIKVDIEGSEVELVANSRHALSKYMPKIILEPHHINGEFTTKEVVSCLSSIGYDCALIEQTGLAAYPLITATWRV